MINKIVKNSKVIQLIGFLLTIIAGVGNIQVLRRLDSKSSADFIDLVYLIFWILIAIAGYGFIVMTASSLKRSSITIAISFIMTIGYAVITLMGNLKKYELMVAYSQDIGVSENYNYRILFEEFIIYLLLALLLSFLYLLTKRKVEMVNMQNNYN